MWNRVSEAWQGRVNIWQICPHTETERSNRRSNCARQKNDKNGRSFCFVWTPPPPLPLCSRTTCSASFLFSKLPRRLETGPVASNPTWTQAWKFQGEKISSYWKDCWPGDLNRCTSGLICTSRVDGCLSVTDNLEINLTDYLLIAGPRSISIGHIFKTLATRTHMFHSFFPLHISIGHIFSTLWHLAHNTHVFHPFPSTFEQQWRRCWKYF